MRFPKLHPCSDKLNAKFDSFVNSEEAFDVRPVVSRNWDSAGRRFMLILSSVPSTALREHDLNAASAVSTALRSVITLAESFQHLDESDTAFMLVNFNHARTVGKNEATVAFLYQQFTKRLEYIIQKFQPTDILCFGDTAALRLEAGSAKDPLRTGSLEQSQFLATRGIVKKMRIAGLKVRFTHTFDIDALLRNSDGDEGDRDDISFADLLYMVNRHCDNSIAGEIEFDASFIKPNPIFIDSFSMFQDLMTKLHDRSLRSVAYDCETANLSNYHNSLLTTQYSFDESSSLILPHDHESCSSIFNKKQKTEIFKELKNWWSLLPADNNVESSDVVGTNLQFDLRILRSYFKIDFVHRHFWDVTAGESLLDENVGILDRTGFQDGYGTFVKTPLGNLRNLSCSYGNPLYYTLPFSKEHRNNIAGVSIHPNDPKSKDVWDYMALDCQLPWYIRKMQIARAKKVSRITPNSETWHRLYVKHVRNQMSNTVEALSLMSQHGSHLDMPYMKKLSHPTKSPLLQEIAEIENKIQNESVVKKYVLKENKKPGVASGGMFANFGIVQAAFDINKPADKIEIFFGKDYLNLEPLNVSRKTGKPSVDKYLFKQHEHTIPLAALYSDWSVLTKFHSTYIMSWTEGMLQDADGMQDNCLRPSYGFFSVVTGRLNSFRPSLHQIPTRSSSAKKVKRAFVAKQNKDRRKSCLQVKWDFSAHEVRMWGNESDDEGVQNLFRVGQKLRQTFIACEDEKLKQELIKELKTKGDIHLANVYRFFGIWVSKDDPLRDAVKGIIFGVLYGKSPATLAKDIFKKDKEIAKLQERIAQGDKNAKRDLERLEADSDKYALDMANDILNKLWDSYPKGRDYIEGCVTSVENNLFSQSGIGRRRNLWGLVSGVKSLIASSQRRGKNAPIQGVSSEIGITSGYLVVREYDILYRSDNPISDYLEDVPFVEYNRTVHDANYFQVPLPMILASIHVKTHVATYGVSNYFRKTFHYPMKMEPEIEIEMSFSDDKSYKWDFDLNSLLIIILKCVCDSHSIEYDSKIGPTKDHITEEVLQDLKIILKPWTNSKMRRYLNSNYPLLGVDLDRQIINATKKFIEVYEL